MRAAIIELQNSGSATRRLAPEYAASVRADDMNDASIGEISTIVRALRSALDKAANSIHVSEFGVAGRRTYFPLTSNPDAFEKLLRDNLRGIRNSNPVMANAIRSCQPFMPGFESLEQLPELYRTNMHHNFELHETRPAFQFTEGETSGWDSEWATGTDSWPGLIVERRTYTELRTQEVLSLALAQDWYFSGTSSSVMGSLLSMHNATVQAIGRLAEAGGSPMTPEELASLSLRAKPL